MELEEEGVLWVFPRAVAGRKQAVVSKEGYNRLLVRKLVRKQR